MCYLYENKQVIEEEFKFPTSLKDDIIARSQPIVENRTKIQANNIKALPSSD